MRLFHAADGGLGDAQPTGELDLGELGGLAEGASSTLLTVLRGRRDGMVTAAHVWESLLPPVTVLLAGAPGTAQASLRCGEDQHFVAAPLELIADPLDAVRDAERCQ